DPVAFSAAAGVTPDSWQARLLRSCAPRVLLNCSRQSGKSTTAATLALHVALYEPGALVLMVSPTQRQSGELFRKALGVYRALGRPVDAESESALQLQLENGSRIVALPGKEGSIRSFSGVRLLLIDEASRVADDLYYSVRPMLAVSGGRLVALSTPFGTRGWWYEAWRSREPWERYEVTASDCPRIPLAFLEEERRSMGDWWYQQEYLCAFLDAQTAAFRSVDIEAAFAEEIETWSL
ncbi:MAG TPA: terminase family protein, partial [Ktedonobacterales bacterium]|nr:terminase family protein [Ktedonobacterales bacterium]